MVPQPSSYHRLIFPCLPAHVCSPCVGFIFRMKLRTFMTVFSVQFYNTYIFLHVSTFFLETVLDMVKSDLDGQLWSPETGLSSSLNYWQQFPTKTSCFHWPRGDFTHRYVLREYLVLSCFHLWNRKSSWNVFQMWKHSKHLSIIINIQISCS